MESEYGNSLLTQEKAPVTRATVVDRVNGRSVQVLPEGSDESLPARLAVPDSDELSVGDSVLLASGGAGEHYVIGVLERRGGHAPRTKRIAAASGATAGLVSSGRGEILEIRNPDGRLLFQYEPGDGKCSVFSPAGDLELHAPDGSIKLVAAENVRLESRGEVSAEGAMGTVLRSAVPGSPERSEVKLVRGRLELTSTSIRVSAGKADLALERTHYAGDELRMRVRKGSLLFSTLETAAKRILERAKDVYRRVEGLHDVRAGRARFLVQSSIEMKGETVYLKGKNSVKINGERIDLG